ncbi:13956_t:CDS:1 [Funneliformis mosseae]|uniref:13956_t:CDS:1 n=1 Tax=Funneliformis mosseae TaxID=27381 RepID=A0A9N8VDY8_FUNMO|nr:13956_t:CDS:1 [Funneliformis mosseae]
MAAASLPELCLERIFEYLRYDLKTQYSCILINRYWCSSLIAMLWENPFEMIKTKNKTKDNVRSNTYLINTYLIYLPKDTQIPIELHETSKQPLFNYASFLRYISIQNIKNSVGKWARFNETPKFKTFSSNLENNDTIGYIAEVLIKHLFTSSTYLKCVDLCREHLCPIPSVYELPNAETKLSQLQIFKCDDDKMTRFASKISRDIQHLEIRLKAKASFDQYYIPLKDFAMLIRAQRNLRKILIQYSPTIYSRDENVCLWDNLMNHTKSLVNIIFVGVKFGFQFPLGCLSKFHNLRRLTLVDCEIGNVYPLDYLLPFFDEDDDYQDNNPLLIRDIQSFHQVEFLSIRTSKIDINKIEILFRQAANSLRSLELLDLDHLKNLESFTQFFSNITRLTVGINARWKIVVSIVKSANLLQELYVHDERSEIFRNNLIERYMYKPMTADSFLCEVGKAMGEQVYMFRFTLDWYFYPNSLNTFLKRCNAKRLKILDFRKCKFFSNEHLNQVIEFCGGTLDYLYCEYHHTFTPTDLSRAKQVIRNVNC